MRIVRQFIGETSSSGPLVVLVAILFALQALIGGFGTGAMAQMASAQEIICSSHGAEEGRSQAPGQKQGMDCCLTACQIAASLQAGIAPKGPAEPVLLAIRQTQPPVTKDLSLPPRHLGLSRDARGPPSFSI